MQKIPKALIKWSPTGLGVGFATHFAWAQDWPRAVMTSLLTAAYTFGFPLWLKFRSGFMQALEAGAEERGERSATWVLTKFDELLAQLRWTTSRFVSRYRHDLEGYLG